MFALGSCDYYLVLRLTGIYFNYVHCNLIVQLFSLAWRKWYFIYVINFKCSLVFLILDCVRSLTFFLNKEWAAHGKHDERKGDKLTRIIWNLVIFDQILGSNLRDLLWNLVEYFRVESILRWLILLSEQRLGEKFCFVHVMFIVFFLSSEKITSGSRCAFIDQVATALALGS